MWLHGRSAIFTLFYAVHRTAAANTINNTGWSRTNARKGGTNYARNLLGFSEYFKAFLLDIIGCSSGLFCPDLPYQ